jgi:hypothetical protein
MAFFECQNKICYAQGSFQKKRLNQNLDLCVLKKIISMTIGDRRKFKDFVYYLHRLCQADDISPCNITNLKELTYYLIAKDVALFAISYPGYISLIFDV